MKLTKKQQYYLDDLLGCGTHEESMSNDVLIKAINDWLTLDADGMYDRNLRNLISALDEIRPCNMKNYKMEY